MLNGTSSFSISILGSSGGVAKAVLAILNQSAQDKNDPMYPIISISQLHLIDIKQKDKEYYDQLFPNLADKIKISQLDLTDVSHFQKHLKRTNTKVVIDVSWADTIEMMKCCNELGVFYINSALENTEVDEDESLYGFPLTERYIRFEDSKKNLTNMKAIVGSGMNPGVVQWMAIKLINENPDRKPLACYIVEHDDSFFKDKTLIKPNTLYTSWSVECFLDEAILSYPMFVHHHLPQYFYEKVYAMEYKVRLGQKEFYGCLMPHEEVITLGKLFDMQLGFIYRVNEYTTESIRNNLANVDVLWDWNQQLLDPDIGEIEGEDLVGVLLVYEDSEKYIYNVMTSSEIYPKFKTNATYFQVACGIYAAMASIILDDLSLGIYYVDELLLNTKSKYGGYLTYHMTDFVTGENKGSDGLLHQRLKWIE
ncbi:MULTISPECIES: saccharopine dehydrogenase NADP-binding domain-containing protein [unclassified Bacillus (in: firmicutes)]|uniref:saccharopine dehydrogenase NADP-binding domain-containing protein n=1 Tax=unclassified Bacillus (in: firmicutes) TaxID=185979 RepID=UPI001BEAACD8|nr:MULTISPECIES: saccharopine dehydrogenase NADP-binding domain-containing protein [unclassified Bacillus (in: firmicutes)]MBT2618634.1 saccharopine dehydrogenase NADP-binding domain-containing protein [Bacillus sp. ISL-78]MBT2632791.1 saccharopine dehydrogenase NADP-binding domain-containing protein [Bacillus sp. ISL-101]